MNTGTHKWNNSTAMLWASRIIRWGFGLALIYFGGGLQGQWPALLFGGVFFISGFFRPTRCIDGQCGR